jgi:hypothetical protein
MSIAGQSSRAMLSLYSHVRMEANGEPSMSRAAEKKRLKNVREGEVNQCEVVH